MEFKTEAQKACYEKIAPLIKELFGEFAMTNDSIPQWAIRNGSALTSITILPWSDSDATIMARSYVVRGAELAPDLLLFLLNENTGMMLGAFGVDSDGDITFDYTIAGLTCDKNELKDAVLLVSSMADQYDDKIVERWGGKRARD